MTMSQTLAAGVSGHRGLLAVVLPSGPRQITGPEGAKIDWGHKTSEYGGMGHSTRRAVMTMPGPVEIEVEDKVWDPTDPVILQLADGMLAGVLYTFYFYPIGQQDKTHYVYSSFVLTAEYEQSVEEVVREPFTLINADEVYRVGM